MKILFVADRESEYLWDYYTPGKLDDIDLIISCGDLSSEYLSFLVTMANIPLLYVPGNHDHYDTKPPEGCENIDGKVVNIKGLRILGLGGSYLYNGGPNQYSERGMKKRIRGLGFSLWKSKGADIVVTHAPVYGYGDGEDRAHIGFKCFLDLIDKYRPKYFVHGHFHPSYARDTKMTHTRGETTIINAYERYILEIQ